MTLINNYVQTVKQYPQFFTKISEGEAPKQFTLQHLKDLGFTSTNHRGFISLLKSLGFLSPDGIPTQRYHEYRNSARSRQVMAEALREAYGDLFVIKAKPSKADEKLIKGKFKSAHNVNDRLAKLMTNTFYSLLELADLSKGEARTARKEEGGKVKEEKKEKKEKEHEVPFVGAPSLNYNIQIHLPATKDIEVFNAIFKSLKEHLVE